MTSAIMPVQHSLLADGALADYLIVTYALPPTTTCRFWQRSINDVYRIDTGTTTFVLRVAPTGCRSLTHFRAEIDLLQFLHQAGIAVPQPVPSPDGTCLHPLLAPEGLRYTVLFTFVVGQPFRPTARQSYRYGQALAHFHNHTASYPDRAIDQTFGPAQLVDEPLARLAPWFADQPAELAWLWDVAQQLRDVPHQLPDHAPAYGVCHGDINDNNFLLIDRQRWALLDFEYIGYGWRVFDIATFVNNQLVQSGWSRGTWRHIQSFVDGYQAVRPLSHAERAAAPAFVVLRQLWLLGRGAQVQPNIGAGPFQDWVFARCLPFLQQWMTTAWSI
jgi:Ser/Thr protein kinase RdoA (MazF antagonist)